MNDRNHTGPRTQTPGPVPDPGFVSTPLSLRQCDMAEAVTSTAGRDLIVLGRVQAPTGEAAARAATSTPGAASRRDWIEVYCDETGLTTMRADDIVVPIRDPHRRAQLLANALADLSFHRDRSLSEEQDRLARAQAHLLRIRQNLIDHHRAGQLTPDLLDQLLHHGGLAPYRPRLRVRFTITGSYDTPLGPEPRDISDDVSRAWADAQHLLVDFTDVDDLIGGSSSVSIHVDDVSPIDL